MQSYKKMEYDKPFFEKVFSTQRMEKYFKLGFWVSLLNSEYERLLWKDLRRAFPFMPKKDRQRKNVSAPLNTIRTFRNRVFHNEPICWNLDRVEEIHRKMTTAMSWINKDVPGWLNQIDRFGAVCENIRLAMGWKE